MNTFLTSRQTLCVGAAAILLLVILASLFTNRIHSIADASLQVAEQNSAAVARASKGSCPDHSLMQKCILQEYYRSRGIGEADLQELGQPTLYGASSAEAVRTSCPSTRKKLEKCVLDVTFAEYDMIFGGKKNRVELLADTKEANTRTKDSIVKSVINNARAQAEINYDGNANSYANVCSSMHGMKTALSTLDEANEKGNFHCFSNAQAWVLAAQLPSNLNTYYCADSMGHADTYKGTMSEVSKECPATPLAP